MSLIKRAVTGIKAPNIDRIPVASPMDLGLAGGGAMPVGHLAQMQSMTGVGWLFATVDRIASALSAVEWKLLFVKPGGEVEEQLKHPLLDLWTSVNPFYTREEFLETSDQHFELTGEMWWLVLKNRAGLPVELWPIRPDRIAPVPSSQEFIKGYIYTVGSERIPLLPEDIIFIRRPSPLNPYRGIGVVQSILVDIDSERMSSQWTRNFFRNSAEPGGIIELDQTLSDPDFEKFVQRWRSQHQGVANAHRVAVLEQGVWKDRKITQRDMQFEQLRKLNRDIILGAFGMPASMLGIAENVNRANAEAAEVMFSRWIIVPRLRRIRAVLNSRLCKLFDDRLRFDFVDPTPENRELNLKESVELFKGGVSTKNESRARVGLDATQDPSGDEFAAPGAPMAFALSEAVTKALKAPENPLRAEEVNEEEDTMETAWGRRLGGEAEAIAQYVEGFF